MNSGVIYVHRVFFFFFPLLLLLLLTKLHADGERVQLCFFPPLQVAAAVFFIMEDNRYLCKSCLV